MQRAVEWGRLALAPPMNVAPGTLRQETSLAGGRALAEQSWSPSAARRRRRVRKRLPGVQSCRRRRIRRLGIDFDPRGQTRIDPCFDPRLQPWIDIHQPRSKRRQKNDDKNPALDPGAPPNRRRQWAAHSNKCGTHLAWRIRRWSSKMPSLISPESRVGIERPHATGLSEAIAGAGRTRRRRRLLRQ